MARDKVTQAAKHRTARPVRFQDARGLEAAIEAMIAASLAPLEDRIEALEDAQASALRVRSADIAIGPQRGGTVFVDGTFTRADVGAPVVIVQAKRGDEGEFGIVSFVGVVTSTRTLAVTWAAAGIPPRRLRINYIIGNAAEE